jgi:tetratricopeptide (TPR) repeat protein
MKTIRSNLKVILYPLEFLILFFTTTLLFAQSGTDYYNKGIDLLYNKNKPNDALEAFTKANVLEPNSWSKPFMIGYTLKNYLQKPAEALPFLEKSWDLNAEGDELPYKETIICLEQNRKLDDAIARNLKAQSSLKTLNKTPSAWFQENLAWLYYSKGDTNKAIQYAPEGSWIKEQLSPKVISIDWNIQLTKLLSAWNITDGNTLRITLPIDRPYQKILSVNLTSEGNALRINRLSKRGNQFLQLEKSTGIEWPDEISLTLKIEQNLKSMTTRPAKLRASQPNDPNYAWASENRDGLFALDDPEFIDQVNQITANGRTLGEKADLALSYLRSHYAYGERVSGNSVKEWLDQGTGDCGYFTYIAIGMLRALKIPVRGLYGIGPWSDPAPALPHSILEIYDASKNQWFPHDPQSEQLFGVINSSYIPFTAGNPKQDAAVLGDDGIWEIDSVWFFWNGSGKDTISFQVDSQSNNRIASRSLNLGETKKTPDYIKIVQSGGPPPVK